MIGDMNLARLNEIFKALLKRQVDKIDPIRSNYGNIEKDEVDMDERSLFVEAYAQSHRRFSFRRLLEQQDADHRHLSGDSGTDENGKNHHIPGKYF